MEIFFICRACFEKRDETEAAIARKHWNSPDHVVKRAAPEMQRLYDQTMATSPSKHEH